MRLRALGLALVTFALCAASSTAARAEASVSVTVTRGDGTRVSITVTNNGPGSLYGFSRVSGDPYAELPISISKWVMAAFTVSPGWSCGSFGPDGLFECRKPDNRFMAAGESMTLTFRTLMSTASPPGSKDCYPANAGATVLYFTQGDIRPRELHAPGPAGPCAQARVGSIEVSYSDYLKKQVAALRTQKDALVRQRNEVQASMATARNRLEAALEGDSDVAADEKALIARLGRLRAFAEQLAKNPKADKPLPADVLDELQRREVVDATTDYLRAALHDPKLVPRFVPVTRLERELDAQEKYGKEVDRTLNGKLSAIDPTLEVTLEKIRAARRDAFALARKRVALQIEAEDATHAMSALAEQRAEVDARLTELARRLTQADAHLTGVTLSSYGRKLFEAQLSSPELQLQQVDADLTTTQEKILKLFELHQELEGRAGEATRELPAANDELAMSLGWGRRAEYMLNLSADLIDVTQSYVEGGGRGIVLEIVKKGADTLIKEAFDKVAPEESGYPPGSPEDRINKEFNAGLKDSLSVAGWSRTGTLRLIKEAVRKPSLDALALGVGKLWQRSGSPISDLYKAETELRKTLPTRGWFDYVEKWIKVANRRDSILAGLLKGPQIPTALPSAPGNKSPKLGLLFTIAKDAVKHVWKGYLDKQKANAWANYAMSYAIAESAVSSSRRAGDLLADAGERYEALVQKKQDLLLRYDPTNFRIVTDTPFPLGTKLEIALTVSGPSFSPDWKFMLSGRDAPISNFRGVIDTLGLHEDANGLGLTVHAR